MTPEIYKLESHKKKTCTSYAATMKGIEACLAGDHIRAYGNGKVCSPIEVEWELQAMYPGPGFGVACHAVSKHK